MIKEKNIRIVSVEYNNNQQAKKDFIRLIVDYLIETLPIEKGGHNGLNN